MVKVEIISNRKNYTESAGTSTVYFAEEVHHYRYLVTIFFGPTHTYTGIKTDHITPAHLSFQGSEAIRNGLTNCWCSQ